MSRNSNLGTKRPQFRCSTPRKINRAWGGGARLSLRPSMASAFAAGLGSSALSCVALILANRSAILARSNPSRAPTAGKRAAPVDGSCSFVGGCCRRRDLNPHVLADTGYLVLYLSHDIKCLGADCWGFDGTWCPGGHCGSIFDPHYLAHARRGSCVVPRQRGARPRGNRIGHTGGNPSSRCLVTVSNF